MASLKCARSGHAAAALGGDEKDSDRLYVTGGFNGKCLATCECYDVRMDQWLMLEDMPEAR